MRSLIQRGDVYLVPKANVPDATSGRLSDPITALHEFVIAERERDADAEQRRPGRRQVGWYDDTAVYLEPQAAFEAVVLAMRAAGETMPVKPRGLWARLADLGVLKTEEADRKTVRRLVNGVKTAVLQMPWSALDDEPPTTPQPSPSGPNGGTTPAPSATGNWTPPVPPSGTAPAFVPSSPVQPQTGVPFGDGKTYSYPAVEE